MRKSRFSEEQIIGVLREQAGKATEEVYRRHGISPTTFYKWKARYGGLEVSEARRLKAFENENRQLKRLLADAMLDNVALKDLLAKTADACGAQAGGAAADGRTGPVAAARLQAGPDRSEDGTPPRSGWRRGGSRACVRLPSDYAALALAASAFCSSAKA